MIDTHYDLIDWSEVEAIVYSEHDNPHQVLGAHVTDAGILVNVFDPNAAEVKVRVGKKETDMEKIDDEGFFSALLTGKRVPKYTLIKKYHEDNSEECLDPYCFDPVITAEEQKKFNEGIHYTIYEKLGAHTTQIGDVSGVLFAVWAPMALRVSVVGDFNLWDGRVHMMRRLDESGIFELFIPELKIGELYKFEIKVKGGLTYLKADPYANAAELRPNTASVITDLNSYQWKDNQWLADRAKKKSESEPMLIYEVHLGSWQRSENFAKDTENEFLNYREIAPKLAKYVSDMGYTHIELMPIMEHPFDGSWGYQVTGYYAPTARYGTPEDFMYFVDYIHEKNIGVILDWVPAHFPRDTFGLPTFDGTCLYEHVDPRQGYHPHWGTLIFNYGRPEVKNFLIANAVFWLEKFHIDGLRSDAVASMLYLDYGKNDGEWVANMYGGHENLEAIAFFKELNQTISARKKGELFIAEESTAWPQITDEVDEGGLGFSYKWNMGWMNDFLYYMKEEPLYRKDKYNTLIFSLVYAWSEKYILVFSHDEVVHGKGSLLNKMPGTMEQKFANLRLAYAYMYAHPGKKLLFMGQDIGQISEWSEEKSVEWGLLQEEDNKQFNEYVKSLNRFYLAQPALYTMDIDEDGFEWINNISANESIIVFLRKTKKKDETLLFVCNFTPVVYNKYKIGVPFAGKYKEVFTTDSEKFGGVNIVNGRIIQSQKDECDNRDHSIRINVPPLGVTVFKYSPEAKKPVVRAAETAVKKVAEKAAPAAEKAVKSAEKAAEPVVKAAETAVKKVAEKAAPAVEKAVKSAERAAEPVVKAAETAVKKVAEKAVPTAEKAVKSAEKAAEPVVKAAGTAARKATEKAAPTAAKAVETMEKATEPVVKAAGTAARKATEKAAPTAAKAVETMEKATEPVVKAAGTAAKKVAEKAAPTAAKAVKPMEKAAEPVAKAAESVAKAAESVAKKASAKASTAKTAEPVVKAAESVAKAAESVAKKATAKASTAKAAEPVAKAAESVAKAAESFAKKATGKSVTAKAAEPVAKAAESVAKAAESVAKKATARASGEKKPAAKNSTKK